MKSGSSSSQLWLPDSSSIQLGPTRLCPSVCCHNRASITNSLHSVDGKEKRNVSIEGSEFVRCPGLGGGWTCVGMGCMNEKGVTRGGKDEQREMQTVSNVVQ